MPAHVPALEFLLSKANPFFKENAAVPDKVRCSGASRSDRIGLLLFIKFGLSLSFSGSGLFVLLSAALLLSPSACHFFEQAS
jgi:hypothetical protein